LPLPLRNRRASASVIEACVASTASARGSRPPRCDPCSRSRSCASGRRPAACPGGCSRSVRAGAVSPRPQVQLRLCLRRRPAVCGRRHGVLIGRCHLSRHEALHRSPGIDQRAVDGEVLVRQQRLDLLVLQDCLQELARDIGLKQPVAVLRVGRVVPDHKRNVRLMRKLHVASCEDCAELLTSEEAASSSLQRCSSGTRSKAHAAGTCR